MSRFVEQIKFLVFREQDGRWKIVGEHTVETMAKEYLSELKRAGYQAGMVRVRTRMPPQEEAGEPTEQEIEAAQQAIDAGAGERINRLFMEKLEAAEGPDHPWVKRWKEHV